MTIIVSWLTLGIAGLAIAAAVEAIVVGVGRPMHKGGWNPPNPYPDRRPPAPLGSGGARARGTCPNCAAPKEKRVCEFCGREHHPAPPPPVVMIQQ